MTATNGLRAILFDWGDTLVRYPGFSTDEAGHRTAVLALHQWLEAEEKRSCFSTNGIDAQRFYTAYRHAAQEQFAMMAATRTDQPMATRLGAALATSGCRCAPPRSTLDRFLTRLLSELDDRSTAMPGAFEVLEALRPHFILGVVSNFPESTFVRSTLARSKLDGFLDTIVVSAEVGRMKPHPAPFERAFKQLALDPAEVLFVGDDLRSDIAGAQALGCHTAWLPLDPTSVAVGPVRPDHHLGSLTDLLTVLWPGGHG
jgi:HAD superfamily hydrolase (TIGR01549 family)